MSNTTTTIGPGFCTLLAIVFITLKLMGYIAWSWWWVLAPLWIPWIIAGLVFITILVFALRTNK